MRGKLLVVDDDENLRNVLAISFKALGYDVVTAGDGEEAEQVALDQQPALVILDVMMPKKNGYAVCRDLKCNPFFPASPIILLTAKNEREDIYWGYDCGADAYMTKPYEPRQLEAMVAQLLQEAAEGKRRLAWTGLPSDTVVEEEFEARLAAGGTPVCVEVRLPDDPREVFSQKYGTAKLRDLIYKLSWSLHAALQETAPGSVLGQRADDAFLIILGHEEAGEAFMNSVLQSTEQVIDDHYGPEDLTAGGIVFGKNPGGAPNVIPLMRLEWKLLPKD